MFVFVIHILQIPHMIWNYDCFQHGMNVCNYDPIIDWLLYSVDLLEIPSIINVTLLVIFHWKDK